MPWSLGNARMLHTLSIYSLRHLNRSRCRLETPGATVAHENGSSSRYRNDAYATAEERM